MNWSIERLEGGVALCEDDEGRRLQLLPEALPPGAKEGDVLRLENGAYQIDGAETARRRAAAGARLSRLTARTRRRGIAEAVARANDTPVSATALAERFGVSRQVVVSDIALLRASGVAITATPRGYLMEQKPGQEGIYRTVACRHTTAAELQQELYLVVDHGGEVLDVVVDHPLYGQLTGQLQIASRYDADRFMQALCRTDATPLAQLTGGIHLHTLRCPDERCFGRIVEALREANILFEDDSAQ